LRKEMTRRRETGRIKNEGEEERKGGGRLQRTGRDGDKVASAESERPSEISKEKKRERGRSFDVLEALLVRTFVGGLEDACQRHLFSRKANLHKSSKHVYKANAFFHDTRNDVAPMPARREGDK
jgi:hypothetical protein